MSKRRLLLADDSVTIQKVVNLTFADEGIEVISVGDGDSAMQSIAEATPDVVLADVHMPGLNGYQICERLRNEPATHDLPVVLLVGSFEPFDEAEAARVGANAFLTKPFQSIRQLVSQVSDLMESRVVAPPPPVTEFIPEPDVPDTSDIDSLYHRSFGDSETDAGESGPPRYVDAGMDDEMIETSHVANDAEADAMTERIEAVEELDDEESRATTEESLEIPQVEDVVAEAYPEPPSQVDPWVPESTEESYAQAAQSAPASSPFDAPVSEAPVPSQPSQYVENVDRYARTEQIPPIEARPTQPEVDLDEIELLELPPFEDGRTLEFTTTQSMAAQGGRKEVVSLSPELMDIIVQKVVEKLSEKY